MLIIRPEQLDVFREEAWRTFLREIEAGILTTLVTRDDPRAAEPLAKIVEAAVALAKRYGFRQRPHLARFARLTILAGAEWESAAARAALGGDGADEEVLLARLEASLERGAPNGGL